MQPKIHEIRAWNFAYRQARKGKWEEAYRDRARFADRVRKLEPTIGPILSFDLRQRIYAHRFSDTQPASPMLSSTREEPQLPPDKPMVLKMILRDDCTTTRTVEPELVVESKQWSS